MFTLITIRVYSDFAWIEVINEMVISRIVISTTFDEEEK